MYYNLTRLSSNHCASEFVTPKSDKSRFVSSGEQLKSKCEDELRLVRLMPLLVGLDVEVWDCWNGVAFEFEEW